ncbi:TerB family tellurite resistance protein [Alphaproteobacteria bacterium]|nr:TerB family tellurite resistance protein [Alphaproteobacteria bacterium]
MFASFKNIFKNTDVDSKDSNDDYKIACVAILCEAAAMDGVFDEKEKSLILVLIQKQFNLDVEQANKVFSEGQQLAENATQLYGFTRVIKESWGLDKRIRLLEMLWEVAYVDGELNAAEDMLIRRIAGLIHVEDRERMEAKQKVLKNIH